MIKKGLIKHEFTEKKFLLDLEWNSNPPDRTVWTQRDWDITLLTKIQMLSNIIHHNTRQGGADTIRLGSEFWMMGLVEYLPSLNRWVGNDRKVGSLCNRWEVLLDFNVHYNEIWVCRERPTFGITVENKEGDTPTMRFNHCDLFDKKKLRGRIKINE
jgi:hypothetical protein